MSAVTKLSRLVERASNLPPTPAVVSLEPDRSEKVLTSWPDEVRGVPNITLRSALFGSSRSASNAFLQRAEIYTQRPTQMRYTGPRLDQGDLDVWITLLHIARQKQMGTSFKTSAYELLKLQGKTDAGSNRKTLYKRLFRLAAGKLEISAKCHSYTGGLIDSIHRNDQEQKLVITLNLELSNLFGPNDFTHIDWSVRRALNSIPLAQWLHGYFSTHAEPYPVSIGTLMMMASSINSSASSREQNLRRALDALKDASSLHGQTFSYEISSGNVYVTKTPTSSQARHIARKASGFESKK
ncbi:TrfA protein [Pseudomonas syringae]|nr:TrfA protein [Pseudomonas syringae]